MIAMTKNVSVLFQISQQIKFCALSQSERIEKSRFSVKLNTVLFLKPAEEDTLEKMCRQSFGPSACKQGGGPSRSQRCYPALPRRNLTKFSLQNSFLRKRQFQFWSWQRGLTLMAWRQKGKQDRIRSSHLSFRAFKWRTVTYRLFSFRMYQVYQKSWRDSVHESSALYT